MHEYVWVCIWEKCICDHFLTMYSNVLHNTTVHSMPLSELSDNFSDHKKIPQPRALSRFCRVKIIRRSVLVHQSYQNLLILQGFQHFPLFFYTVFTRFSKTFVLSSLIAFCIFIRVFVIIILFFICQPTRKPSYLCFLAGSVISICNF